MDVHQFTCPHRARNYSYLIVSDVGSDCVVIDPSFCAELLTSKLTELSLDLKYIINTHSHNDHIWGNKTLKDIFPKAKIVGNYISDEADYCQVQDSETISFGNYTIDVVHTPGHTPEDICLHLDGHLFTGDVLFNGKVGGTSSREAARIQFHSLKKVLDYPDETIILPGHDYGKYSKSTIKHERETNPFCTRLNDFEDFMWLKDNWQEYKEKHGL